LIIMEPMGGVSAVGEIPPKADKLAKNFKIWRGTLTLRPTDYEFTCPTFQKPIYLNFKDFPV